MTTQKRERTPLEEDALAAMKAGLSYGRWRTLQLRQSDCQSKKAKRSSQSKQKIPENHRRLWEERDRMLEPLAAQGLTVKEAAAHLSVKYKTAASWILRLGLRGKFPRVKSGPKTLLEVDRAKKREYNRQWMAKKRQRELEAEMQACGMEKGERQNV